MTSKAGDGYIGWKEHASFDAILVTAAAPFVPEPLIQQLEPGGFLVIPVGSQDEIQSLLRIVRLRDGSTKTEEILPVRFVPLVRDRYQ